MGSIPPDKNVDDSKYSLDQSQLDPPTSVDCLPTYGNNYDELTFYGECHGYRNPVTDSVQQSNKEPLNYCFQDCGDKLHFDSHDNDSSCFFNSNDTCDNSTYDIAKEFYDDLECFITNNVDNNGKLVPGVIEFESLTHHLLDYCEQYTVISDE